jgi:hypothetical protein
MQNGGCNNEKRIHNFNVEICWKTLTRNIGIEE